MEKKEKINEKFTRPLKIIVGHIGGKFGVRNKIIQYFPEHKIFVEVFGGSAAVLLGKRPSDVEVYNDIDDNLCFLIRYVKNITPEKLNILKKKQISPNIKLFNKFKEDIKNKNWNSDTDRFYKLLYIFRNSYAGLYVNPVFSNRKTVTYDWDKLLEISERLKNVAVYSWDYRKIIKKFDSKDTLFYIDPPYWNRKQCEREFGKTNSNFEEFVEVLKSIKGKFVTSYPQEIKGFYHTKLEFVGRAHPSGSSRRFEYLIFNFKPIKRNIYTFSETKKKESKIDLPEITIIPDFVSLTGSTVYGKHIPNDLDIVLRFNKNLFDMFVKEFPEFLEQLKIKLERMFKRKVHFIPCSTGPNWDYKPMYDLVLRPSTSDVEVVDSNDYKNIAYNQELRVKNKKLQEEADETSQKDEVSLDRFFFPEKTNISAIMVSGNEIPDIKLDENLVYFAQKKYDGNRIIIYFYRNKEHLTRFISEDGSELNKDKFKNVLEQLKELKGESFILDSEMEIWKEDKKLNREDVSAYLHNKEYYNDSGIVFNVFDILYKDSVDIHKEKLSKRLDILKDLGFNMSVIDIPDTKYHFNLSPSIEINSKNYKEKIKDLVFAPASEGCIIKKDTSYKFGYSSDWIKVKKYETLRCIVLEKIQTKVPTVFNYKLGVSFNGENIYKYSEDIIVKLKNKLYLEIGYSYNTSVDCNVGDIISIRFHTFNLYKDKHGKIYANVYEPVFEALHKDELTPDYIEDVIKKAERSNLLVKKFIEDLYKYDPAMILDDKVLLDDYRILLAWYSKVPKRYSKNIIKEKLYSVIGEILKRKIAVLKPDEYANEDIKELVIGFLKEFIKEGIVLNQQELEEFKKLKKFEILGDRNIVDKNNTNKIYWVIDKDSNKIYGAIHIDFDKKNNSFIATPVVCLEENITSKNKYSSETFVKETEFSDNYLLNPDENSKWRYVIQLHFRGKSVHMDLRNEFNKVLKGWTLLFQIPGYPENPVLTLKDAKNFINENHGKIDLKTGEFKERKTSSGIIRQTSIRVVQKADEPLEWLNIEGIAEIGTPGSTTRYPGVFYIWDKGNVEYGSVKPYFYEYFYNGNKFNGRYIIRALSQYNSEILPASKVPEEHEIRVGEYWILIKPNDQTPYIFSDKAIEEDYIPPIGYSYLPLNIRNKIPKDYQYWKFNRKSDRIKIRNILVENLSKFEIKFSEECDFQLFRIIWKRHNKEGLPVNVVRLGPSTEVYLLKINDIIFQINDNLLKTGYTSGIIYDKNLDIPIEKISETELKNKSVLNPTKKTWSKITKIDSGNAIVYINQPEIKKFKLKNKLYIAKKEENSPIWSIYQSDLP